MASPTLPSSSTAEPLDESTIEQRAFPSLPNDIGVECLARIPRLIPPRFFLVCKAWHNLLRSGLFFRTRQALNTVDDSLYLNLHILSATDANNGKVSYPLKWFNLRPSLCPSSSSTTARTLVQIASPPSTLPIGAAVVSFGSKIYFIGGYSRGADGSPIKTVSVYDSISTHWEMVDSQMRVAREFAAAGVVNDKIYVMGGCPTDENWAEMYDPQTGEWVVVPSPEEVRQRMWGASVVCRGKIYMSAGSNGVVFDPRSREWSCLPERLKVGLGATAVGGVVYCYDSLVGKIKGFDLEQNVWKELKGVARGFPLLYGAMMANVGGRLVVVWEDRYGGDGDVRKIRVVEIEAYKDGKSGELRGLIRWCGDVLGARVAPVAPVGSLIVNCLAV